MTFPYSSICLVTPDMGMALNLNLSGHTVDNGWLPLVAEEIRETRRRIETTSNPGGQEEA
ncbi:MAG: hypothetical protein ABGZ53_34660 [Fuerstiella sp.]